MDEAKKKYLEDLRKQIDPKVLEKMVKHLASDSDEDTGPVPKSEPAPEPSSPPSAVDLIKKRRNSRFQDTIARVRRESEDMNAPQKVKQVIKRTVLILSSTTIWTRIVDNHYKSLGFTDSENFSDFASLFRFITTGLNEGTLGTYAVAVSLQDIPSFIKSWESLRRGIEGEQQMKLLDSIPFFLTVESIQQVKVQLVERYGSDRIICVFDEPNTNREKVEKFIVS